LTLTAARLLCVSREKRTCFLRQRSLAMSFHGRSESDNSKRVIRKRVTCSGFSGRKVEAKQRLGTYRRWQVSMRRFSIIQTGVKHRSWQMINKFVLGNFLIAAFS
jgi:hypothetical protein